MQVFQTLLEAQILAVVLDENLPVRLERAAGAEELELLHETMQKTTRPWIECMQHGLSVRLCGKIWKCHTLAISYCCDSPARNDTFGAELSATVCACNQYLVSTYDKRYGRLCAALLASQMNEVLELHENHYRIREWIMKKRKATKSRAKLDKGVSFFEFLKFEINWRSTFSGSANGLSMEQESALWVQDWKFRSSSFGHFKLAVRILSGLFTSITKQYSSGKNKKKPFCT